MKRNLKVHFIDFPTTPPSFLSETFGMAAARQGYFLEEDKNNPDFLFCSCFGFQHIKYSCAKICLIGENWAPDFNSYDYALASNHIEFEDRYFRLPVYRFFMIPEDYEVKKTDFFKGELKLKNKFCNFIYSNSWNVAPERDAFYHFLSQYKKIDSGGRTLNNIGQYIDDKVAWQRNYKFSIAFENSSQSGYTTEKILHALRANTIPIYWGDPRIKEEFNSKRFINCQDYNSYEEVLEVVKVLDEDSESYFRMLTEPWFRGSIPPLLKEDTKLLSFFERIIEQGPQKTKRITTSGHLKFYFINQKEWYILRRNIFVRCYLFIVRLFYNYRNG